MEEPIQIENTNSANMQLNPVDMRGVEKRNGSSTRRVFDKVADFCNQLPFAGKLMITPIARMAVEERNTYYKTVKVIEAEALLGTLALIHTSQAILGISNLSQNIELMKNNPTPETILACGIDVAYTAANVAATYSQLHLGGRLAEHFYNKNIKSAPNLTAWGIKGGEVDYEMVAERLMTAIVNDDQSYIDTFFMILPKEKKQKAMENIKVITEVVDETYSYDEVDQKILEINKNVENKSRFRYIIDIMKNSHDGYTSKFKSPYSIKQAINMIIVTYGAQFGFLGLG